MPLLSIDSITQYGTATTSYNIITGSGFLKSDGTNRAASETSYTTNARVQVNGTWSSIPIRVNSDTEIRWNLETRTQNTGTLEIQRKQGTTVRTSAQISFTNIAYVRIESVSQISDIQFKLIGKFFNVAHRLTVTPQQTSGGISSTYVTTDEKTFDMSSYRSYYGSVNDYSITCSPSVFPESTQTFRWINPYPILTVPVQTEKIISWSGNLSYTLMIIPNTVYLRTYTLKKKSEQDSAYITIDAPNATFDMSSYSADTYILRMDLGPRFTTVEFTYTAPPILNNIGQIQNSTFINWGGNNLTNAKYYIKLKSATDYGNIIATNVQTFDMANYITGTYILKATVGTISGYSNEFEYIQCPFITNIGQISGTTIVSWTTTGAINVTYSINGIVITQNTIFDMASYVSGDYTIQGSTVTSAGTLTGTSPSFTYSQAPILTSVYQIPNTTLITRIGSGLNGVSYTLRSVNGSYENTLAIGGGIFDMSSYESDTYVLKATKSGLSGTFTFVFTKLPTITSVTFVGNIATYAGTNLFNGNVSIHDTNVLLNNDSKTFLLNVSGLTYDLYFNIGIHRYDYTNFSYFTLTGIDIPSAPQKSTILLYGENFSNISTVMFGNTSSQFILNSSKLLSVKVPDSNQSNCSIIIYDLLNNQAFYPLFTYTNISVTNFTPTSGKKRTTLELSGINLSNVSAIYFGNVSTTWIRNSETNLSVKVPIGVGNVSIGIWDIYGNNSSYGESFTYEDMMTTIFTPSSAPAQSTIELSGTNISNLSAVYFGNENASWTWNSPTNLSVKVPRGVGNVSIGIWDIYGNNSSYVDSFTYTTLHATTFTPTSAPQRSMIELSGVNLSNVSAVYFGYENASWTWNSSIQLSVKVPDSNQLDCSIGIWDIYGNNSSYPTTFHYTTPLATTFTPTSAPQRSMIELSGQHFSNISAVYFGNDAAEWIQNSSTNLSVKVPRGVGNVTIGIWDLYGNNSSVYGFTYANLSITGVTSPAIQRSTISITGIHLSNLSAVYFGNTSTTWTLNSSIQMSVQVPPGTEVSEIGVWDIYGNNSSVYGFTYAPLFSVTTFTPRFGVQRSSIVLRGNNFSHLDTIEFGNTSTRNFSYSDTTIQVIVPDSNQPNCSIQVRDLYGNQMNYVNTFTYRKTILREYDTLKGPSGTELLLSGDYLQNTRYVTLGNISVNATYENTQVRLIVPEGDGSVPIVIYDIYDNSSNSVTFLNEQAPVYFTYTNMSAYSANISFGTTNWPLRISGKYLNLAQAYMGGELVESIVNPEGTLLSFPAIPGIGNASIQVKDDYGHESLFDFEYRNPKVTRFNVSKGRTRLSLNIYGEHLHNTSYVLFGGVRHLDAIQVSEDYIEAVVPETYGNVSVDVVDLYDNHALAPGTFLCLGGNASIYSVAPNQGTQNASVTIFGENLEFSTQVQFGAFDASLNLAMPSFLNVSVPKGESTVNIKVTDIVDGSVYSYGSFTYQNASIFSMTPSQGPTGIPVTLSGEFLDKTQFLYFGNTSISCVSTPTEVTFVVPDGSLNSQVYLIDTLGNVTYGTEFIYRNPRLDSITPSAGPPRVPITLRGLHLENSSFLRITGVPGDLPLSPEDERVQSTMPDGSGTVVLTLTDRYLNRVTTSFTYQIPRLSQVTPSTGPQRQSIILSGEFLENTSYVTFGTHVQNVSLVEGTLVVDVPDGTGNVSVTAYDKYLNVARYDTYQYQNPYARSITSDVSGATVILEGDFLENISMILFGNVSDPLFRYANGSIAITVPPGRGNVSVTAYDKYWNDTTITFYYLYPELRSITPSTGPQRQSVLFEGDTLSNTSAIFFGDRPAVFEVVQTNLSVQVPDGSNDGSNIPVTVYDLYGNTAYGSYTYNNPYAQPANLSGVIGSTIQLIGDLEFTTEILFGGIPRPVIYANGSLSMTVPSITDPVNVSVIAYDKYLNSASISFEYLFPTIVSVEPPAGPTGHPLRLIGDHLENTSYVEVGTTRYGAKYDPPYQFTYANGSILFTPYVNENSSIVAYDIYGNAAYNQYEVQTATITSLDVYEGAIGSTVRFTGDFLANTSIIYFGNRIVETFTQLDGSLYVTVPPPMNGVLSVPITAYDAYSNPATISPFQYLIPTLTGTYSGPQRQTIFLQGTSLEQTTHVAFGNISFPATYQNGQIEVIVPDQQANNVSLIVYDKYLNEAHSNYLYLNPTARSMNVLASVIGNTVFFRGDNLEHTTKVFFGPYEDTRFYFTNGNLSIIVPPGEGTVSITAYDQYQNTATLYSFDYLFPTIRDINPSTGPQKQYVYLTGDYLSNTSYVRFNQENSPEITWLNHSLRVKVPDGEGHVTVTAYDLYDNPTSIGYTYLNPIQSRFSFQGATERWPLTIEGDHLQNISKVHFYSPSPESGTESGSLQSESLYLDPLSRSKEKVVVILPPGDTTQISMIDVYGNETIAQAFVYRNPQLTRLSNLSGRTNLYMTLTGSNLEYTQQVLFGDTPQLGTLINNVFDTRVQAVVPEVYGTVPVRVIDACGNETSLPFFSLGGNASISKLEPNHGPNGVTLNILGENLGFTKEVTLGGFPAEIQYPFNASRISVTVPPSDLDEVNTLVYDILDESVMFYGKFYYKNPSLFSCSFSEGTTSTPIVIQGINLSGTKEVFLNTSVSFTATDTEIRLRAPRGEGTATISVRDAYQNVRFIQFTYQNPSVTVIDRFGATGSRIYFSGQYLSNTSAVYFNASAYSVEFFNPVDPSVQVPPGNASVSLTLEDIYGNTLKAGSFTYQNPILFALDPAEGLRNTYLNLSGLYLQNISYVQFGQEKARFLGTSVLIPQGTDTVPVYAVDIYDNVTETQLFTYVTPEITSLEPAQGPTGSLLNLSGKFLRNVSYVQVGDNRLYDFSYVNTGIQVVVPVGSGNVSVYFESIFQNVYDSPVQFTYANPDVVAVNPSRGPARQIVTLTGSYLQNTSTVVFRRDETEEYAMIVSRNASSVQVKVPEFSGITEIVVTDLYGNTSSSRYEYQNPLITDINGGGPLKGGLLDRLVISGVFLENTSTIRMIRPVPFTRDPLTITVINGRGKVPIELEDIFGNKTTYSELFEYTYTAMPQVDIYPYYAKPGDKIRVNLPDPLYAMGQVAYLEFGTQITQITARYDTYVEVIVPEGSDKLIQLLDISGELLATNQTFEYETIRVTRIYPTHGFVGETVLIEGDFTPASRVFFGLVPYGDLDPAYLGTVEYIHAHALLVTIPNVVYEGKITVLDQGNGFQQRSMGTSEFRIKHPRIDSTVFTENDPGRIEISGLYLSNLRFVQFGSVKVEVSGTDTVIRALIPKGYGTVAVSAIDPTSTYPLGLYTYPVEVPAVLRTGAVRCLAISQRLYWTNDRTIYNDQGVVYIHTQTITSLAAQTELYFCDNSDRIYRYHPITKRYLPPYGLSESPKIIKVHQHKLYALLSESLWTLDLLTNQQVTYPIEPANSIAFDGDNLYVTRGNSVAISTLTGENSQTLMDGLTNPKEIAVQNGHLFVSGSVLHYTLDPPTLVNQYETDDQYTSFAWSGQTLYLSNTTQSQIETLTLPSMAFQLDTMTSTGTENAPFELTGEGLDQISTVLFDHRPVQDLLVCSTRITGKIPKGVSSPQIEILDAQNMRIPHRFTFAYENTQLYVCCPAQALEHVPVTLIGEYLDRVIRVYMGGIRVDFTLHMGQLIVSEPLPGEILLIDRHLNVIQSPITFSQLKLEANICFCAGTMIHTDQGPVEIQKIQIGHTVYGKEIKGLTETYYTESQLVKVPPHAFHADYPYRETVMSKHHKIWFQGKMVEAQALIGYAGISWTPYHHEKLYNVLLDEEGRMNVQGMICETLDPANPIAARFRWAIP